MKAPVQIPDQSDGIEEIAKLAVEGAGLYYELPISLNEKVNGLPDQIHVLLRKGKEPQIVDVKPLFEKYRTAPERREGTAKVTTLASFIDLVDRHKDDGSAIFAATAWPNPSLTAVIDYHAIDHTPRFGKHRIAYAFPLTDELKAWVGNNGQAMGQGDFAAFIENRIADLASPYDAERTLYEGLFKTLFATPSHMVDLSRGLQVRVAAEVKNATMLQSGEVEMVFREEHQNDKGEKITVPGLFMVQVPAFVDGEPVRIPARLRYRLREGKLTWFYQLYRWETEIRNRVGADLEQAHVATGLPVYEGTPEIN